VPKATPKRTPKTSTPTDTANRRARIGVQVVRSLSPGAIVWDTDLKGFGVRVQRNQPAYFVKTRVRGRQKWLTIGRHGQPWTPDTARTEALRLLTEASQGRPPRPLRERAGGGDTVAAVIERFLNVHGPKLKPRSLALYRDAFARFIKPAFAKDAIGDIGTAEISRFHVGMQETPRQANTTLTVLSSLISWATDQKLRPRGENPCASVRRFKENKRDRFLSRPELERLAAALDKANAEEAHSEHSLAAIRLLILTGARVNEILTLEWAHVSIDNARLALPDSKTGAKTIELNAQAIAVLKSLSRVDGNRFVIVGNRTGQHMKNLHSVWDALRVAAKIEDVRLHDLRHSFASFAVDAGASLPLIGKLLGHNSPTTTARYAHIADARAREVNTNVGAVIAEVMRAKVKPVE
jgi:integrase